MMLALMVGFVILSGARGGCFYSGPTATVYETYEEPGYTVYETYEEPEVIVYETTPSTEVIVVEEEEIYYETAYYGDLAIRYDFSGYSCWDMDVETLDIAIFDVYGNLIYEEWDDPCTVFNELYIADLDMGDYYVTMIARDYWGYEILYFDGAIGHYDYFTSVDISLF